MIHLLWGSLHIINKTLKAEILQSVLRSYVKWLKGLSEKLAIKKEIFEKNR
jgi:hypothetical protein